MVSMRLRAEALLAFEQDTLDRLQVVEELHELRERVKQLTWEVEHYKQRMEIIKHAQVHGFKSRA